MIVFEIPLVNRTKNRVTEHIVVTLAAFLLTGSACFLLPFFIGAKKYGTRNDSLDLITFFSENPIYVIGIAIIATVLVNIWQYYKNTKKNHVIGMQILNGFVVLKMISKNSNEIIEKEIKKEDFKFEKRKIKSSFGDKTVFEFKNGNWVIGVIDIDIDIWRVHKRKMKEVVSKVHEVVQS